ncbi:MAG: TonB-dependent receptor [Candidatus Latescibacterota bacterium]
MAGAVSLRRVLFPGLGAALLAQSALPAGGAAADLPWYEVPTTYVSATRIPGELAVLGRHVVVLDSAAIAARAPATVADLLASLPGVHPRVRGPFGAQTDLEMAGASFGQVLLLLDGVRVTDPQTAHHNLNLPLGPQDLERVEVLYGPGSSVHGPDASGGVVNLVPRHGARRLHLGATWVNPEPEGPGAAVSGVGSQVSAQYGWTGGGRTAWVAAGQSRADGYRRGTGLDVQRARLGGSLPGAGGRLEASAGVEDKAFGARDFYAPYPSREWTRLWLAGARLQRPAGKAAALSVRLQYRRHRDRFVLTSEDPARYENRHLSQLATLESYVMRDLGRGGQLVVGQELVGEGITSTNLGDHARHRLALFAEYAQQWGGWGVGGGGRLDRSSGYGWLLAPSLRLWRAWPTAQVFAALGRASRAPSFTELYYRDPANVGHPGLRAEQAWCWEGGVAVHPHPGLRLQGSLFLRDEEEVIDYVRPAGVPPWTARNLGGLRATGVLVEADLALARGVGLSVSHTYLHKTRSLADSLESKYVFTHPEQLLLASLGHPLGAGTTAAWQLTGRQGRWSDDYVRVDLALSRRCGSARIVARGHNLTDQRYEEVAGLPLPGRWFGLETWLEL